MLYVCAHERNNWAAGTRPWMVVFWHILSDIQVNAAHHHTRSGRH